MSRITFRPDRRRQSPTLIVHFLPIPPSIFHTPCPSKTFPVNESDKSFNSEVSCRISTVDIASEQVAVAVSVLRLEHAQAGGRVVMRIIR